MRAFQLVAPRKFEELDLPVPVMAKGRVLIRTACVSICGSDWYTVNHGREYDSFPLGVGFPIHEVAGIVVESDAPEFRPGDRALEIGYDGGLKEFHLRTPEQLVKLPAQGALEELLMSQPLGVVLHATRKWPSMRGASAAVIGQGSIGQFFTAVLKMQGASTIIAIDKDDFRLGVSKEMGASHIVNAAGTDAVRAVKDILGGDAPEMVVEACGLEETFSMAVDLARREGMVTLFGLAKVKWLPFRMADLVRSSTTVYTSNRGERDADFALARDLIVGGSVRPGPLITHRLPVGEVLKAFELAESRADNALKIVLEF